MPAGRCFRLIRNGAADLHTRLGFNRRHVQLDRHLPQVNAKDIERAFAILLRRLIAPLSITWGLFKRSTS